MTVFLVFLCAAPPAFAETRADGADIAPALSLAEAIAVGHARQPRLRQAEADVDVAAARVVRARAPLLPQVFGSAHYQRTTTNFAPRPGFTRGTEGTRPDPSFDTVNCSSPRRLFAVWRRRYPR